VRQLQGLFPDEKGYLSLVAEDDGERLLQLFKRLHYTDSVVCFTAWLCIVLTPQNVARVSASEVEAAMPSLVQELVIAWEANGGHALHPAALLTKVLGEPENS
jgi:hypothetical protein